jgi:CRP-like cAMP-binding protein
VTGTFTALILALERRDHVSEEEKGLLGQLPFRIRTFAAGEELVVEGSRPTESCLVLSGFAARQQHVSDGKRQLTAIHIAGDFVDLHSMLLKVMDHSVVSLGGCLAAFVPHTGLQAIIAASPHLGRLLWLSTVIDGAIERNWVTCLGRRPSNTHLAHLICELYARLETVGLVRGQSFELPLTQSDIADTVGLSVVHVNRMIQELRASGLIIWDRKTVTVLDIDGLRKFADFDPTYLNLVREPR